VAAPAVLAIALAAGPARAAGPPPVRLDVVRKGDTKTCPDDAALRREVAAQLGSDPFDDGATPSVAVVVSKRVGGFAAEITRRTAAGETQGTRTLTSTDCTELFAATAEALAILLQPPIVPNGPPKPPEPEPAPAREPTPIPAQPEETHPVKHESASRPAVRVAAGALGAMGSAPAPALGFTVHVGVSLPRVYLGVEGRGDLEASKPIARGMRAGSSLLLGAFASCGELSVVLLCGLAAAGAIHGVAYKTDTTPWAALGLRLAPGIRVGRFDARVQADLLASLVRTTLRVTGVDVWSAPPVNGALGLVVGGRFQ
jgi:hypothetical protein